ncbi:hypothetical protein [Streptomyces eurythermus]|uniref:hypothetical protein n=1 Tax=Streptomyces eurythermus TaxID=42237 RepID=UPI003701CC71
MVQSALSSHGRLDLHVLSHIPEWSAFVQYLEHTYRQAYAERLTGKALTLVDSTGFSWESAEATLGRLNDARIDREVWNQPLFQGDRRPLAQHIGLIRSGEFIALAMQDWVNGASVPELEPTISEERETRTASRRSPSAASASSVTWRPRSTGACRHSSP